MKKTYTVIYRTGGTDNFKWNKVTDTFTDYNDATIKAATIEKMGYKTIIHDTEKINNIGLPETY
jgi:hypothetical protein